MSIRPNEARGGRRRLIAALTATLEPTMAIVAVFEILA
jgi:hypothetical protein